jgi:hypothetical protein
MQDEGPQFCPWCGSPTAFEPHEHEPRYAELAERSGADTSMLPERVRNLLAGNSFVAACGGCRTISHVVGHRTPG